MKKLLLFFALLCVLGVGLVLAQDAEAPAITIDPNILGLVVAGLGGMPLASLIEMVKRLIFGFLKNATDNLKTILGYVISAAVCFLVAFLILSPLGMASLGTVLLYGAIAWMTSMGYYKMSVKAPQGK
jgi:hypothetical protein